MIAQLSVPDLLANASMLEMGEFDLFFKEIMSLRATRLTPVLSPVETVLLAKIYKKLSEKTAIRIELLTEKRVANTIQSAEYTELLKLSAVVEKFNVQRLHHIIELAKIRKMIPQDLMNQLGLMPLHNG
jgi:hypothetical protein